MAGFTFDSPFRIVPGQDSQQVANRETRKNRLPSSKIDTPSSFLSKAKRRILGFSQKTPVVPSPNQKQAPASPFPFFSLPLRIRQQIYGHVLGTNEKLHILRKHRPSKAPPAIGYRRCRADISGKSCAAGKCKELSILEGVYCGWFDRGLSLLLTSKQIYKESTAILYEQNTFDFDDPLSLLMLALQISPASLNSIQSISFELRGHDRLVRAQWEEAWGIVSSMQGLQDVRVKFLDRVQARTEEGEKELLGPLFNVTRELRVFEVVVPWAVGGNQSGVAGRDVRTPFVLRRVGTSRMLK